jgi:NAD(P)H-dependent FMN reductase
LRIGIVGSPFESSYHTTIATYTVFLTPPSDENFFTVDGLDLTSDDEKFDQDIHALLKDV